MKTKPRGYLYCFEGVKPGHELEPTDGYLIRDMRARRFLRIEPFTYQEAARDRAIRTLTISRDDDACRDIEVKDGVTWAQIMDTKGLTHAEIVARFEG